MGTAYQGCSLLGILQPFVIEKEDRKQPMGPKKTRREFLFAGKTLSTATAIDTLLSPGRASATDDEAKVSPAEDLGLFTRMDAVHMAREDSLLFPALRTLVPENRYEALGEQFEKKEHDQLGDDGFERFVTQVAELEKSLGIDECSSFTPKL